MHLRIVCRSTIRIRTEISCVDYSVTCFRGLDSKKQANKMALFRKGPIWGI